MVKSGQSVTVDFTTLAATGALANAASTPTGTLVVNGVDNAAVVTVTNKATGIYKASVILPSLAAGDLVQLRIAATIGSVATGGIIWQDVADIIRLSDGVTLQDNAITSATFDEVTAFPQTSADAAAMVLP
jgi:hypothetical protein